MLATLFLFPCIACVAIGLAMATPKSTLDRILSWKTLYVLLTAFVFVFGVFLAFIPWTIPSIIALVGAGWMVGDVVREYLAE